MFKLLESFKKAGITAEQILYSFGYYFDGKDNNFSFPAAVINIDRTLSGKDISEKLYIIEKICKKHKYAIYDKKLVPGSWTIIIMRKDNIEKGLAGYAESTAFKYGFWNEQHKNPCATDEELIAAGHDEMIKHGYAIRN